MKKKILSCILVMAMLAGLTACSGKREVKEKQPVSGTIQESDAKQNGADQNKEVPLEITCALRDGEYSPTDIELYKELEEKTGVKINWTTYIISSWPEKKSLLFASNQLPEAFFGSWVLTADEVVKYGAEGVLIPLEDYITEENTPNLYKIFQDYPDYKSSITAPDGHIYSLMGFDDGHITTTSNPLYINKEWLENVGKNIPTTMDEFYEVLKAFKEQDANGNGDPNDEIPYSFNKGVNYASDLFGAFGMPDNVNGHIGVKDGKVIYTAVGEEYKEAIKYFNGLFKEELIDQEAFTQDGSVFGAKLKAEERTVGVFQSWRSTGWALKEGDESYVAVPPLSGPDGERYWPKMANGINDLGAFAITNVARDPEYIMHWVDNCYDPLFSVQASLSLKVGVHLQDAGDGTYETLEKATSENRAGVVPGGAERISNISKEAAALLKEVPAHLVEKQELDTYYNKFYYSEMYPTFLFSAEESDRIATLKTEINDFVNEKYATWMMNGGIEEEWDSYIKQLDKMGLQELLKIYQTALDRYNENLK